MKYIQTIFNFIYAAFLWLASIVIGLLYSVVRRANNAVYYASDRLYKKVTQGENI